MGQEKMKMKMNKKSEYQAGVCNIGLEEIKKRKQAGWIGLTSFMCKNAQNPL